MWKIIIHFNLYNIAGVIKNRYTRIKTVIKVSLTRIKSMQIYMDHENLLG